jgi:hypothetical protein
MGEKDSIDCLLAWARRGGLPLRTKGRLEAGATEGRKDDRERQGKRGGLPLRSAKE